MNKKNNKDKNLAEAFARSINTLDSSHIESLLTGESSMEGVDISDTVGAQSILDQFNGLLCSYGISELPIRAEVASLWNDGTYTHGVLIAEDGVPHKFITLKSNENGQVDLISVSTKDPDPFEADRSGLAPGFDAAKYKARKDNIEFMRRAAALQKRPHFIGIFSQEKDPTMLLLIIEELNNSFEGSTFEVHAYNPIDIQHSDTNSNVIRIKTGGEKAYEQIGGRDFPCIGVMAGDTCVRPAYKGWHPDCITEDLIKLGMNLKNSEKSNLLLAS